MRIRQCWLFSFLFILLSFVVSLPATWAKDTPREIGGFTLGTSISSYQDVVQSNYLKEILVTDWHGFRRGVVSYGTCRYKDEILKITMKYEDRSKKFYRKLLKKFRSKYGPPDIWNGDSFGVVYIWKWHFIDENKNRVSLSLQFNAKNTNETIGNMVKLSYPEKIKEERLCFIHSREQNKQESQKTKHQSPKETDWQYLIPR